MKPQKTVINHARGGISSIGICAVGPQLVVS